MAIYIEFGALLISLFVLYLLVRFLKDIIQILANSIAGVLIFVFLNSVFGLNIPINLLSVGVVAIGGIAGVLLIVFLHILRLGF